MPEKGGTYTIVVDRNGKTVSVTYNGVMMIDKPETVTGSLPVDVNLRLPPELSGCVCLGQFFNDMDSDQDCRIIWGDLV